ncbi:MAG: HAMP domain-containing histidine kinase [Oscillospiraceae bacterium]|nr:HAMP domain-containing histidine kinase [Oscillospiraceae bacterium]
MEQENMISSLLELVERPALCVCNGTIVQVNQSARQRMIHVGMPISDLLAEDNTAYAGFQGGTLTLNTVISGVVCKAQVSRIGDKDIFVLEADDPELRAIALAAQHLRNPLNSVITVSELISCDNDKYMSQLQRGLHRLHRIVCNMSDSYRYQQDSAARMETTDIPSVIDESMEAIRTHLEGCGIQVQYTGLGMPVYGLADREMLERAVYNLISNAVKFMADDGKLSVKLMQNENQLSFTVQTSGTPSNPNSIFKRYQRQPGVEDSRHGIGLGMPLVRAVAAAHGGTVLIDHPDEETTRITMTISVTTSTENVVRSSIRLPVSNYAGDRDRGLLELSEILPADAYQNMD